MKFGAMLGLVLLHTFSNAQEKTVKYRLSKTLKEISGLEKYNDTILVAINDGGNSPEIFFLNLKGEILRSCFISNATNNDWEDLTLDDKRNLYIGDIGNNLNTRVDLCILKLNVDDAYQKDSIEVEKIYFNYKDQTEFPPPKFDRNYDCEAIYFSNDSIHLVTKNTSKKPTFYGRSNWDRLPNEYLIPTIPGNYELIETRHSAQYLHSVRQRGIKDLITAVDCKNEVLAVLTYSQLRVIGLYEGEGPKNINKSRGTVSFKRLTQKEAVVIFPEEKSIFIGAERNFFLGGPFLYKLDFE